MPQFEVNPIAGVSKKDNRPYVAYRLRMIDDNNELWESEFLFPRFHKCDSAGRRISMRPVVNLDGLEQVGV